MRAELRPKVRRLSNAFLASVHLALGFVLAAALVDRPIDASQRAPAAGVQIDADDIGGVVQGTRGPEVGVWVIAETSDLPTKLIKIVVTDDRASRR